MDNVTLDDILEERETYTIVMTVPGDFSDTTAQFLEELIHNLLVWWVLYNWLSMTKPEGAEKWLVQEKEAENELKRSLSRLCGRVRRPLRPFS